ncbi:CPBP family intramembrane glutamic endopeptidase [Mycobacterium tuberculosis]|uniref:Rv0804 family intramembrane glutamic endopeptidase n=1 Tax=Mycobacterium tuberculosis TaxID=1773 RepID=UPI000E3128A4|nr:CPBP family intramembrane glutamic endopeptidase [Mycobacterium tuberculosis]REP40690.1 CPBP family intramembrane metalloprotease [Mycobacterium tuberculosis]
MSRLRALSLAAGLVGWSLVSPRLPAPWRIPLQAGLGSVLVLVTRATMGLWPPRLWAGLRLGWAAGAAAATAIAAPASLPASVPVWLVWHIPGGTVWAEEAAFRGALATIGARAFGRSGGRILQAGAFGLSHIADARATGEPLVLTVLATGIAGWMFGWLADRSGSLAAPLLTHLAINEAGAVAAVLVQRRSGISTRL